MQPVFMPIKIVLMSSFFD